LIQNLKRGGKSTNNPFLPSSHRNYDNYPRDKNIIVSYGNAKKLVDKGFSVIPIKAKDKAPAIQSWKEYQNRMPTEEELHVWFDPGDKNVGIICGRVSGGLVVVDFDDPAILDFLVDGGIDKFREKTLVVRTNKGYHVFFKVPVNLLQNRRFDNLKIDIKGEGGYVVAPPSIHREGTRYEFLNDKDVEYNEKFGEFLAKLQKKDEEFKYVRDVLPYWIKGKRNYNTVGLTVYFKRKLGWSLEKITDFIYGINRIKPFSSNPFTEREIRLKAENAYQKEYNYEAFLDKELIEKLNKIAPHVTMEQGAISENVERGLRELRAVQQFEEYFDIKATSKCADKLMAWDHFFAIEAPGAEVNRLTLFAYNGQYYSINGSIIVAQELEDTRKKMIDTVERVRRKFVPILSDFFKQTDDKTIKQTIEKAINALPKCEIKQNFREEVCVTLAARNIVDPMKINVPPNGYIFAIALKNGILLGKLQNGKMQYELADFTPALRITRQLNISLTITEEIIAKAKEWYQFTLRCFGEKGALQFYQGAGYSLITKYPLPNERVGLIIVGDPGTGKGTHLAALEQIFRNGAETFYAHVTPHKLTDAREHFSRQNLRNRMLLIAGDIPHTTIPDYSKVNDLLGGESTEIEQKFKDPITEIPTFKVFWASAPPLHRVKQAGGAFRRFIIIQTRSVAVQDNDLKPRLLSQDALEGVFLNMVVGLATFVENNFKYTDEPTNDKIEELWEELTDSVGIYIGECLNPSSEEGDARPVKEVYEDYVSWCKRKQIEPVKEKTFAQRLKDFGDPVPIFTVKKKKIEGKAVNCVWAQYQEEEDTDKPQTLLNESEPDETSWRAFISRLPEIHDMRSDLFGQITRARDELYNKMLYNKCVIDNVSYIKECPNESEPEGINAKPSVNQAPAKQKTGSDPNSGSQKEEGQQDPKDQEPSQEPEPKKEDDLNRRAIDFFKSLKDKFEFFKPPEERRVTREPDNVVRYLHYVEGMSEDDAKSIISKWEELGLVEIVQNQVVLKNQAQEGDKNGNDK